MKRLTLLGAWTVGLVLIPAPAYGATPEVHYTVVRVNDGTPGSLPSDREVVAGIARAQKFWAGVPGAPKLTFTIMHGVQPSAPSMNVVAFYPTGDPRFGDGTAHGFTGQPWIEARSADWQILAHEIGHNLGFDHDRTHETWAPVYEYGNPFSIMGSGAQAPSAWQQVKLGWLASRPIQPDKWWKLWDLDSTRGPRTFTFASGGHSYSLEYRSHRSSLDTPGGVAVYRDGFLVHYGDDYTLTNGKGRTLDGARLYVDRAYGKDHGVPYARVRLAT